jgi:hypothetical protein
MAEGGSVLNDTDPSLKDICAWVYLPLGVYSVQLDASAPEPPKGLRTRSQSVPAPAAPSYAPVRAKPSRPPNPRPTRTVGADRAMPLRRRDPEERPRPPSPRGADRRGGPLRRRRSERTTHAHRPRSRTSSPDASPDRKRGSPSALRPEAQGTTGRRNLRHDGLRPDRRSSTHCPRRIPRRAKRGAPHRFPSSERPAPTASEDERAIDVRRNPPAMRSASPSFSFARASIAPATDARRMSNANAISSVHWGRMPANR